MSEGTYEQNHIAENNHRLSKFTLSKSTWPDLRGKKMKYKKKSPFLDDILKSQAPIRSQGNKKKYISNPSLALGMPTREHYRKLI